MRKLLLSFLLCIFGAMSVSATNWTDENGVTWTFYIMTIDGTTGAYLCGMTGNTNDVIVPDYVFSDGTKQPVIALGGVEMEAFSRKDIVTIKLPSNLKSIFSSTFSSSTNLKSVDFNGCSCKIEERAFYNCSSLISIDNSDSITGVGNNAFYGTALFNNHPDGLVYAGSVAYKYKGTMPENTSIVIKDGTKVLADNAFSGCSGLTSVTIPNSVISIGSYAFYNCKNLTSIDIPNSVTSIGLDAFKNTAWFDNQPDGLVYAGSVAYKYKGTIPENTSIVIKDGTKFIADKAFYDCSGLTSIDIPNSVTTIGNEAFRGCFNLTSIDIPNSVTNIGNNAFSSCSDLTSVTIPNSVTNIGYSAFQYCTNLKKVSISDLNAWCNIKFGISIDCSSNPTYYAHHLYLNGEEIKDLSIPSSVTSIGQATFYGCTSLTSVSIPNSVTSIGACAFSKCSGLTSVSIPNSVTSIGASAFDGCSGMTSVTIPNSVSEIGGGAFRDCFGLTSVTIPNSVSKIGGSAFQNCSGLTSVTIPSSVSEIEESAFNGCSGLRDIYSNNVVPPTCGKSVFSGVKTANCRLHVPVGSKEEYAFADGWCDFYNILEGEGEGESELEKLKAANKELQKENEALKQEIACYSLGDLNKDGRTDIDDVAVLLGLDAYSSDSDALAMLTEGTCITPAEIQEKYGDVEYYTVDGVKVAEPSQNGIYIVKKNGVTKMIVVKK